MSLRITKTPGRQCLVSPDGPRRRPILIVIIVFGSGNFHHVALGGVGDGRRDGDFVTAHVVHYVRTSEENVAEDDGGAAKASRQDTQAADAGFIVHHQRSPVVADGGVPDQFVHRNGEGDRSKGEIQDVLLVASPWPTSPSIMIRLVMK